MTTSFGLIVHGGGCPDKPETAQLASGTRNEAGWFSRKLAGFTNFPEARL
jgi:hypothetical protein